MNKVKKTQSLVKPNSNKSHNSTKDSSEMKINQISNSCDSEMRNKLSEIDNIKEQEKIKSRYSDALFSSQQQDEKQRFQQNQNQQSQKKNSSQKLSEENHSSSIKSNQQKDVHEELKGVYDHFLKLVTDKDEYYQDTLQIEAFYYQLSTMDFHIQSMLSLPQILAYYTFAILINNITIANTFLYRDQTFMQFYNKLSPNTKKIIIQQGLLQSQNKYQHTVDPFLSFLKIIPDKQLIDKLDVQTLLDDFQLYSNIGIQKMQGILESLQDDYIWRNKNILIAFMRFYFYDTQNKINRNFRIPIGDFTKRKFTDLSDVIDNNENVDIPVSYKQQLNDENLTHSEKALIHFILYDSIAQQHLFKLLGEQINQIDNNKNLQLQAIRLEITSENRMCEKCVLNFDDFPIQTFCKLLNERFKFKLDQQFYLVVSSQYLNNSDSNHQLLKRIKQIENQEQNQCQTKFYIIQQELGQTGLISQKFYDTRYSKNIGNDDYKIRIDQVLLRNTFFINDSEDFEENKQQQISENILEEQQIQNILEQEQIEQIVQKEQSNRYEISKKGDQKPLSNTQTQKNLICIDCQKHDENDKSSEKQLKQ